VLTNLLIIVGVPFVVSIVSGLMIAPLQKRIESYAKKRAFRQSAWMQAEYLKALTYYQNPRELYLYLFSEAPNVVRRFAFMITGGFFFLAINLATIVRPGNYSPRELRVASSVTLVIVMICLTLIVLACFRVSNVIFRVQFFEEYQKKVLPDILAMEKAHKAPSTSSNE
jgi:hypothetical protein